MFTFVSTSLLVGFILACVAMLIDTANSYGITLKDFFRRTK